MRSMKLTWSALLVLAAACGSQPTPDAPATTTAALTAPAHCVSPVFGNLDLNVFYGVTEQIVAPGCSEINVGQKYRVWAGAWMNDAFDAVPTGFVPIGDTPLEDFVAKFVAVKYVVDPGTDEEETFVFPNSGTLWTGTGIGPGILFTLQHVNTLTLNTLHPLPVGPHRIDLYWTFSAMFCDGLSDSIEQSCIPAGDTRIGAPGRPAFDVVSPHG
jgi:hypothetical protein